MDCAKIRDLLPDYSVQLLNGRTHRAVEEHLAGCRDCREELRLQDSVMDLVASYGGAEPPVGLFNGVRNRIEGGAVARDRPAWWSIFFTVPARGIAMGLAMAAVAVGLWLPTSSTDGTPSLPPVGADSLSSVASTDLGNSIRQHAMTAAEGPLSDRVAWEATAQLVTQRATLPGDETSPDADEEVGGEF